MPGASHGTPLLLKHALDDQEVTLAFTTIARAIGLSAAETARTLASARTAGLANPRTVPVPADASRQEVGP